MGQSNRRSHNCHIVVAFFANQPIDNSSRTFGFGTRGPWVTRESIYIVSPGAPAWYRCRGKSIHVLMS